MSTPTIAVLVTRADGGVTVLHFVTEDKRAGWSRLATRENVDAEIARASWAAGEEPVSWRFADESEVPTDRTYRDAWVDRGREAGGLGHDMPKARELHRQALRHRRAPLLDAMDVEYMQADEANDQKRKREIGARKQELRDVTAHPSIEAAQDVAALKLAAVDVLEG